MSAFKLGRALLACAAIPAFALPSAAGAQQIDRIVAFGDSYADDGNFFQLAGINPLSTGVYTTGRFSGGTNYIDTLADILDVPVDNFAIGGARTNTGNQTPGLPGFTSEIAIFSSGGGGVFPTVDPTFDEHDLVTISIGGNDSRAYQQGGGTVAGAGAAAATAVGFAEAGMDVLVAAGAPTISFLAGDTSRLPEVNFLADPVGAAAVRSAFSSAFNLGIQNVLAGYADAGVIVHYLDLNAVLDRIAANPGDFGFTGLACPAFPPPVGPGVPGSTVCADQSVAAQYLVYGDQLHLTSAGFAIVARYVAAQLAAPLTLQAPAISGLNSARRFGQTLSARVDLSEARFGEAAQGLRLFAFADGDSHRSDATDDTSAFKNESLGATVGAEMGFGNGIAGIAASVSRPKVRFGNNAARVNGRSLDIGGYAGFDLGGAFAQLHAGYGSDKHRIRRAGVIDDLSARPDGNHVTAGIKAGYLVPMGAARIGPIVALDYARAKVDGYVENGDPALQLEVGSQKLKALYGQLGIEARANLMQSVGIRPYASAVLEKDLEGDDRVIDFSQLTSPGIVNHWTVDGSKKAYGRVSGGATVDLTPSASIQVAATTTIGRQHGDDVSGHLGVQFGF